MNTIDELISEIRSILAIKPVSYQEIARVLHDAPFTQEHLRDTLGPMLLSHLSRQRGDLYEVIEPVWSHESVELRYKSTQPFDVEQLEDYVNLLLGGFSGLLCGYYCDSMMYPSDGSLPAESLYVIRAHYDSGDSFGESTGHECLASVIQGYQPMKKYLEFQEGRDSSRMTPLESTDPEYKLKHALGLHHMQRWEGYFERLRYFSVLVVMDVKGPT